MGYIRIPPAEGHGSLMHKSIGYVTSSCFCYKSHCLPCTLPALPVAVSTPHLQVQILCAPKCHVRRTSCTRKPPPVQRNPSTSGKCALMKAASVQEELQRAA